MVEEQKAEHWWNNYWQDKNKETPTK